MVKLPAGPVRDALFTSEQYIRLAAFCGIFGLMASWELFQPRRKQMIGRGWRWPNNLGVVAVDTLLVRIVFPTTAVGLALVANTHGIGLFNVARPPFWVGVVASVILLDLAIYFQHVLFHAVPLLWRLHRMHHADLDIDVSTARDSRRSYIARSRVLPGQRPAPGNAGMERSGSPGGSASDRFRSVKEGGDYGWRNLWCALLTLYFSVGIGGTGRPTVSQMFDDIRSNR